MNDLPGNEIYLGAPATSQREQMQIFAVTRRLPEMRRELKQLRATVADLQKSLSERDQHDDQDQRAA